MAFGDWFKETFNIFDEDNGFYIGDVPIIGKFVEKSEKGQELIEDSTQCENVNAIEDNKMLVNGVGIAGGGLLGYKIGENFGTIGKIAGGILGAWAGAKLSKGIATDVAAGLDHSREKEEKTGEKSGFIDTSRYVVGNLFSGGQKYDGKNAVNDADPDPDPI